MKKILKYLLLLIIIVPLDINASFMKPYSSASTYSKQYINKFNHYQRFIVTNSGSMISKNEFESTIENGKTYLINGKEYWTSTSSTSDPLKQYYVGFGLNIKDNRSYSGVRVTESLNHGVVLKGNGTYNTPWEFVDSFYVRVTPSIINSNISVNVETPMVVKGGNAKVTITEAPEYAYSNADDCKLTNKTKVAGNGLNYTYQYEIKNIKKDINCVAKFKAREIQIYYDCDRGTSNNITSTQKVLYGDNYTIQKITSTNFCKLNGYKHIGWKTADGKFDYTNKSGKWQIAEGSDGVKDNELHLKAVYQDITAPSIKVLALDKNNNSNILEPEKEFKPEPENSNYSATYVVKNYAWFNKQLQLNFSTIDSTGIKKVYRRYNSSGKTTENDYKTDGSVTIDNVKWHDITDSYKANESKLISDVNVGGYRKLQYLFVDNNDNKTTITIIAKIDLDLPVCKLLYTGSKIEFINDKVTDSLSGVVERGIENANSTPNYNSLSEISFQKGTTYGFVKDEAGNEGVCSLKLADDPNYRINFDSYYVTLQDAFAAAKANDTIYLLHNYTDKSSASTNKTISLNLRNLTLTKQTSKSKSDAIISTGGTFTILGGGSSGTLKGMLQSNGGHLVVRGTYITNDDYAVNINSGSGNLTISNQDGGASKSKITSTENSPIYRNDVGGSITLTDTYVYTKHRNKNAIRLGTKKGTSISIGNGCILANGTEDTDGAKGSDDYGIRAAVISIRGEQTTLTINGSAVLIAGAWSGTTVTIRNKNSSFTLGGSASLYSNNKGDSSDKDNNPMYNIELANWKVGKNTITATGNSITINTTGNLYTRGGHVYGTTNYVAQTLTVSAGKFCFKKGSGSDATLFNNGTTYTNSNISITNNTSECTFKVSTGLGTYDSPKIKNMSYGKK